MESKSSISEAINFQIKEKQKEYDDALLREESLDKLKVIEHEIVCLKSLLNFLQNHYYDADVGKSS